MRLRKTDTDIQISVSSLLSLILSLFLIQIQSNLFVIISDNKCHCCFGYLSFDLIFVVT